MPKPRKAPELCGAKTRSGSPCRRAKLKGRPKCGLHGGKTPAGKDHYNYKHGIFTLRRQTKGIKTQIYKDVLNSGITETEGAEELFAYAVARLAEIEDAAKQVDLTSAEGIAIERLRMEAQKIVHSAQRARIEAASVMNEEATQDQNVQVIFAAAQRPRELVAKPVRGDDSE